MPADLIRTPLAGATVVSNTLSPKVFVPLTGASVVVTFPAREITSYQIAGTVVSNTITPAIKVTSLAAIVVAAGRVANPRLRAWTFTLDTHPFYVLRLGDGKSLVYDLSTGQWSWWSSGTSERWRLSLGFNWDSPKALAQRFGSNIIAGDDTGGHLWFLDPEQGYDDTPGQPETPVLFPRVATAQLVVPRRETMPVYEVYLSASAGYPALTGMQVTLSYSDDAGVTYVKADSIVIEEDNTRQEFAWRSLGLVSEPGRLFRIEDEGGLARVDGLDVWDGATS